MSFRQGLNEGEAEAGSLWSVNDSVLGLPERLKCLPDLLRGNADARIGHRNHIPTVLIDCRGNSDPPSRRCEFDSVAEQIDEYLEENTRIGTEIWKVARNLTLQPDMLVCGRATDEAQSAQDRVADVHGFV